MNSELILITVLSVLTVMLLGMISWLIRFCRRYKLVNKKLDESARQDALLLKLVKGIATARSLREALELVLYSVCHHTKIAAAESWIISRDQTELKFVSSYSRIWDPGIDYFIKHSGSITFAKGESLPGMSWKRKNVVWLHDLGEKAFLKRKSEFEKANIKTGFAVPVPLDQEVIAVLCFYFTDSENKDPHLVSGIEALAGQLGMLIKEKNTEDFLIESEARFRSVAESTPEAVILANEKGIIENVNNSALQIFGYERESMIGQPLTILMPEKFRTRHSEGMERYLKTRQPRIIGKFTEMEGMRSDGTVFPIELSISTWSINEMTYFSGIIRDISFRKQEEEILRKTRMELQESNLELSQQIAQRINAENKLRRLNETLESRVNERTHELKLSEERFRLLNETIPIIVWTATPEGKIDYFNSKFYEYSGKNPETIFEEGWADLIPADDMKIVKEVWDNAVRTREAFQMENRIMSKSGEMRWFLIRGLPLKTSDGRVIKWVGTCTDIHDQKRLDEKKDEFIGIASHELKTPLTSIKAYMQLLERKIKDNESGAYVEKANVHVDKLQNLVEELLDVSKITAGKLQFSFSEFDFGKMVADTVESIQYSTKTHMLFLRSNVRDVIVTGDQHRLEQVVVNYLTNAIKYSPGGKEVIINVSREGNNVIVAVKDFGLGIPEDMQDKIFDRFYRVDNVSPNLTGLGIGLYITANIIKVHNGKVWVESKEGKGSTFYFSIPVSHKPERV